MGTSFGKEEMVNIKHLTAGYILNYSANICQFDFIELVQFVKHSLHSNAINYWGDKIRSLISFLLSEKGCSFNLL